jgi:hypothetical protein
MLWIGMFTGENFLQVSDILVGNYILVGALEHEFYDFPYLGNFIIPTDELIFFRLKPPTSISYIS